MAADGGDDLKFFSMQTDNRGITTVTFNRPPVNAMSFEVYPELRRMSEKIMPRSIT